MCEVMAQACYVRHHKKKIAFVFSAMRHFAEDLRNSGYRARYTRMDDRDNQIRLPASYNAPSNCSNPSQCVTEPGEWCVLDEMKRWSDTLGLRV